MSKFKRAARMLNDAKHLNYLGELYLWEAKAWADQPGTTPADNEADRCLDLSQEYLGLADAKVNKAKALISV